MILHNKHAVIYGAGLMGMYSRIDKAKALMATIVNITCGSIIG